MSENDRHRFTAVTGFFEHDDEPEGPQFRATTRKGLGLLNRTYSTDDSLDNRRTKTSWDRFVRYLDHLNKDGPGKYKLFCVLRHGEGEHNVKEAQKHWARLDGDDTSIWFDAHLSDKGRAQAKAINDFLKTSSREDNLPLPARHYTSPLARCLETSRLAFSGLDSNASDESPVFVVKENLRERLGVHTCDRRRSRKWIHEQYPDYVIEDGFSEEDELWRPDHRESSDEHVVRIKTLLTGIFENDSSTVISLTAHSGAIRALYEAIGHKEVWVGAGAMVPVLIRSD
ncbi:hypothetical protein diail_7313 [Diaporthe ilicicola]|nr:hypothetical protein diail_7313 [Diaporthe ilicicola]